MKTVKQSRRHESAKRTNQPAGKAPAKAAPKTFVKATLKAAPKAAPSPARAEGSIQAIREVFGYLRRYNNQVFVIKIEDALMGLPLFSLLVRDIVLLHQTGIRIVLVPGAKTSIDTMLERYKVKSKAVGGVRLTTAEAMPLVKLGASNISNALLSLLSENEAHGVVGNWVRARAMGVLKGVDYQRTGRVEKINDDLMRGMMDDGLIPIVSNIGWNSVGQDYNLNSSELAVAVAQALRATKLFFVGSQPGIPVVKECPFAESGEIRSGYFSNLDRREGEALLKDFPKALAPAAREQVALALRALEGGVERVHVVSGARDGILLQEVFSSAGQGTMFYQDGYDHIHPAQSADIPEILRIMQPYVDAGVLVQRGPADIARDLEHYTVYKIDDVLHGCGALKPLTDKKGPGAAELLALVVDPAYADRGTGGKIVNYLLQKARKAGLRKVFLLTTQTSDFFLRLGFKEVSVSQLPPARKRSWNPARNSKVLMKTV
jgi:amino-acid N-acetyltransferase